MKVKEDDSKFEVTLDVSDYRPEELKVTTVNNVLSIEGKHEQKTEDSKVKILILPPEISFFPQSQSDTAAHRTISNMNGLSEHEAISEGVYPHSPVWPMIRILWVNMRMPPPEVIV